MCFCDRIPKLTFGKFNSISFVDIKGREVELSLRERVADLCHSQWVDWMEYLFFKSTNNKDGTVTVPKWAVDRWKRQMKTSYTSLSTLEKDTDRKEADKYIACFKGE